MENVKPIVLKYYEVVRRAVDGKEWQYEEFPFSEEIAVIGPNEQFIGTTVVREMFPQFFKIVKDFSIKDLFFSENTACGIVEFFPVNGSEPVLTAEWFQIEDGKIVTLTPIYNVNAWSQASQ